MSNRNAEKVILGTLVGVAAGIAVGILVAPDKGSKTRKKISKKSDGYLKDVKKEFNGLLDTLNQRVEKTKKEIEDLGNQAKNKAEEIKEEASEKAKGKE